jgi:hypothetical protein
MSLVVAANSYNMQEQAAWPGQAALPPQVWQRLQAGPRALTVEDGYVQDTFSFGLMSGELLAGNGRFLAETLGMFALKDPRVFKLSASTPEQVEWAGVNYARLLNAWAPSVTGANLFSSIAVNEVVNPAAAMPLLDLCNLLVGGLQTPEGASLTQVVAQAQAVRALL